MKIPKNKYPMSGKIEYNYNYSPKTTIVINYFTSLKTLLKTIDNFRSLGDEVEIVVINDRFGENTKHIMKHLTHRNDRMVVSRDLAERRGYHHGALLSNASDFIIFTQDDDLAPDNNQWYLDCLKEFNNDPTLGIIGMLKGGVNYAQKHSQTFTDQYDKIYVSWLATGPLMVRKDVYFKVNGWSEEYSKVGEPDGGADADITTKILLAGYKTLLLRTPAVKQWLRRHNRDDGVTNENIKQIKKETAWGNNSIKRITLNNEIYYNKYKKQWEDILKLIKEQNKMIGIII